MTTIRDFPDSDLWFLPLFAGTKLVNSTYDPGELAGAHLNPDSPSWECLFDEIEHNDPEVNSPWTVPSWFAQLVGSTSLTYDVVAAMAAQLGFPFSNEVLSTRVTVPVNPGVAPAQVTFQYTPVDGAFSASNRTDLQGRSIPRNVPLASFEQVMLSGAAETQPADNAVVAAFTNGSTSVEVRYRRRRIDWANPVSSAPSEPYFTATVAGVPTYWPTLAGGEDSAWEATRSFNTAVGLQFVDFQPDMRRTLQDFGLLSLSTLLDDTEVVVDSVSPPPSALLNIHVDTPGTASYLGSRAAYVAPLFRGFFEVRVNGSFFFISFCTSLSVPNEDATEHFGWAPPVATVLGPANADLSSITKPYTLLP